MAKEKKENKTKKEVLVVYKALSTIVFILSVAYLAYSIISTESILTNINDIMMPLFIFFISLIVFISSLKVTHKSIMYILLPIMLLIFMLFTFMINNKVIKLPEDEKMISYTNKPYNDLSSWAEKNNIELIVEYEHSDEVEKGNIIRLDVLEGSLVKDIKTITATISDGPDYDKTIIVPSMLGWNVDDALDYIKKNFLNNVTINFEKSDSEKDIIYKQSKNGEIRRNSELILTASLGTEIPDTVEMINLKDKTLFEALTWLKRNDISYELKYEFNDKDINIVIGQNIESGKEVNTKEDIVVLNVSKGKSIKLVDFTKMNVTEITDWVLKNNLKVIFEEIYSENIETGKVIKQDIEPNTEVASGTLVTITISRGQIKMQKFSNLYEFKEWANKYNVKYSESYEYSDSVSKGNVISYSYSEGDTIDPDDVIYIRVSLGKAISIPSFIGKSKSEAQTTCNNLGIRCSFTTGSYSNTYSENVVYAQSRNSGTKVASGSSITLTLSKGTPKSFTFTYGENDMSFGNAQGTINKLKSRVGNDYPGVTFNYKTVAHNSYSAGMILPTGDNCIKNGTSIKQGSTYTICVVG